jgi:hypothetical protein
MLWNDYLLFSKEATESHRSAYISLIKMNFVPRIGWPCTVPNDCRWTNICFHKKHYVHFRYRFSTQHELWWFSSNHILYIVRDWFEICATLDDRRWIIADYHYFIPDYYWFWYFRNPEYSRYFVRSHHNTPYHLNVILNYFCNWETPHFEWNALWMAYPKMHIKFSVKKILFFYFFSDDVC